MPTNLAALRAAVASVLPPRPGHGRDVWPLDADHFLDEFPDGRARWMVLRVDPSTLGTAGAGAQMVGALAAAGFNLDDVSAIVLTKEGRHPIGLLGLALSEPGLSASLNVEGDACRDAADRHSAELEADNA